MSKLTVITSIYPEQMSKEYSLQPDGTLSKKTSANLASGSYEQRDICSLDAMAAMLENLTRQQVLVFGVPQHESGVLTTKDAIKKTTNPSVIARSNSYLKFSPKEAWMFLDYDPHGDTAYSMDEIKSLLEHTVPEIFRAGAVMYPSASSNIVNTLTGEDLTGNRGIHIYLPVTCGLDIRRAGEALQDRLWLGGHGYIEISKSGSLLERTLLDPSVSQDAKIDFAAGAICHAPLEQRRGKPFIIEATHKDAALDTAKYIKNARDKHALAQLKETAKGAIMPEALEVREKHARTRGFEEAQQETGSQTPPPEAVERCYHRIMDAIKGKPLHTSYILYLQFGRDLIPVTVGTVLGDPDRYDGLLCLDPLEPSYLNSKVVGKISVRKGSGHVSSFAHGGRRFNFGTETSINLHIGRKDHMGTAKAVIDLLTDAPEFGFLAYSGEFYLHGDSHYETLTKPEGAMFLMTYLSRATCTNKDGAAVPVEPDNALLANVTTALSASALVRTTDEDPPPPFVLEAQQVCHGLGRVYVPRRNERGDIERGRYIALRNGMFDLYTNQLVPHSIAYFNTSIANFDYVEGADCPLMMATVNDWFDRDQETIDTYFRMLGYLMSSETAAHKIFGLFGPARSGKGITQGIIADLVGASGIFSTDLDVFSRPKGLEPIINKKVLLFADVKDSKITGNGAGERLLKISASDLDSVPRMYKVDYRGRHTARVVMCGNAPPRIPESSRALMERFIIMTFTKSYLGKENEGLADQLRAELPGIFNRCLQGLREWQAGARFISPGASGEHIRHLRDSINLIPGFIENCCEVGNGYSVDKTVLFEAYRSYLGEGGNFGTSMPEFCKRMYAYDMKFKDRRVRRGDYSGHVIENIRLIDFCDKLTLANGQEFQIKSAPDSTVITGKTIRSAE